MHFTENMMEFGKIKSVNTWVEEEYKVHYATKAQQVENWWCWGLCMHIFYFYNANEWLLVNIIMLKIAVAISNPQK